MVSRQRRWQIRKQSEGKCIICGQPRWEKSASYCYKHHVAARNYINRRICKREWEPGSTGRPPMERREEYEAYEDELVEAALEMLNEGYVVREVAAAIGKCPGWIAYRIKLIKTWVPIKREDRPKHKGKKRQTRLKESKGE